MAGIALVQESRTQIFESMEVLSLNFPGGKLWAEIGVLSKGVPFDRFVCPCKVNREHRSPAEFFRVSPYLFRRETPHCYSREATLRYVREGTVEDKISEAVRNWHTAVPLQALQHMRMMPDHDIGTLFSKEAKPRSYSGGRDVRVLKAVV
jgi:hypothetical protein